MNFNDVYREKTVCVTGHTGFKGSWMSEWLLLLGAEVVGYALDPPTSPSHFDELELSPRLKEDIRADVRSVDNLREMLRKRKPDFVFHLAAQSLVRRALDGPHYTFETNLMGTVNLLEAVRLENRSCIVIMITTDKVYENLNSTKAYVENDALGGHDPYSASKACAEIAISSYRRSFFSVTSDVPAIAVASARAGNVLGGGDWAEDRIVPDCVRHLLDKRPIPVRNRNATRPWQHVLEPLGGYLHLGAEIFRCLYGSKDVDNERLKDLCSAFNFGPSLTSNRPVSELVEEILLRWPGEWKNVADPSAGHEAGKLNLSIDKAREILGWQPQWDFEETVRHTVEWYRQYYETLDRGSNSVEELTRRQIASFSSTMPY